MTTAVDPTAPHSMKCPKLYGQTCRCDGYHTFEELYDHRHTLFIALCRTQQDFVFHGDDRNRFGDEKLVWRSKVHADSSCYDGWFIMGLCRSPGAQMNYHLPMARWHETDFAETLDQAPAFDGHTSDDVLARLSKL